MADPETKLSTLAKASVTAIDRIARTMQFDFKCSGPCEAPQGCYGSYLTLAGTDNLNMIALLVRREDIQALAGAFLQLEFDDIELELTDMIDALGEMVNMIGGSAKMLLNDADPHIELGIPVFVEGSLLPTANSLSESLQATIGDVEVFIVAIRDKLPAEVIHRRRMAKNLADRENRLRAILTTATHGIVTTTEDGIIEAFNPAAEAMFGIEADDAIGMEIQKYTSVPFTEPVNGREAIGHRHDGVDFPLEMSVAEFTVDGRRMFAGILSDITSRREAEAALDRYYKDLASVSRRAGMAEVATGVLHNVGNALNSVNVTMKLIEEHVRGLKLDPLSRAVKLLDEQEDLAKFFSEDERGKLFPQFLSALHGRLIQDRDMCVEEIEALENHVTHIKSIVSAQQSLASRSNVVEAIPAVELIDEALNHNEDLLLDLGIVVEKTFEHEPIVSIDKHKTIQILSNLVKNAAQAIGDCDSSINVLRARIASPQGDRFAIEIEDTGIGISQENMDRIFNHGFTTRSGGHGFGLHYSALQAGEMGAKLTARSEGPGCGATFVLEIPVEAT